MSLVKTDLICACVYLFISFRVSLVCSNEVDGVDLTCISLKFEQDGLIEYPNQSTNILHTRHLE